MGTPNFKIISFAISKLNLKLYNKAIDEIERLLSKGEDIPFKVAKDMFSMQMPVEYLSYSELQKEVAEVLNKAIRYFEADLNKSYYFRGRCQTPIGIDNIEVLEDFKNCNNEFFEQYSLHSLFYFPLLEYYRMAIGSRGQDRDYVIKFFYTEIRKYRDAKFTKEDIKRLTHYKLGVMAAYLAYLVGYIPTKKKKFTKRDLFQSSKNAINKLNHAD